MDAKELDGNYGAYFAAIVAAAACCQIERDLAGWQTQGVYHFDATFFEPVFGNYRVPNIILGIVGETAVEEDADLRQMNVLLKLVHQRASLPPPGSKAGEAKKGRHVIDECHQRDSSRVPLDGCSHFSKRHHVR